MLKSIYTAVKFEGEVDVIAFESWDECLTFCNEFEYYEPLGTSIYSLKDARSLFPNSKGVQYA